MGDRASERAREKKERQTDRQTEGRRRVRGREGEEGGSRVPPAKGCPEVVAIHHQMDHAVDERTPHLHRKHMASECIANKAMT